MKTLIKRISAALLVLFIVVSLIPSSTLAAPASSKVYTTPTGYTKASDVQYSTATVSGKQVVANWGARGEDCEFLSSYATGFYTGNYTFANLSALSGGTTQNNAASSQLYSKLQELLTSKHTFYTYYDGNKNVRNFYKYTDCVSNNTSKVALLYVGTLVSSTWDAGNTWNQEHVWPQSKLSSSEQIGDIMHLRPENPSENSSRGNKAFGESSGYYNPGPSVRGDCARMVLYMYVRWGKTNIWGSSGVMENMNILLKWMAEDPVDTWEMGRNDAVQTVTGTRNVFVDYPELAWLLFGQNVPSGITTPSGNDGASANPGGNTPATTAPATTAPATKPATTAPATKPATTAPATKPATTAPATKPATTAPATKPATTAPAGGNETTPPASQPSNNQGNQIPAETTKPNQPAPMATSAVTPPTLRKDNTVDPVVIIAVVLGAIALAGGTYFLITHLQKKKGGNNEG